MAWDIVRKQGLYVDDDSAAEFKDANTFRKYIEQFFKIGFPCLGVLIGSIVKAEIIERRGDNHIHGVVGYAF